MKEVILITGATGAVGREVVKALLSEDVNIMVGVRNPSNLNNAAWKNQVKLVELDYDKEETLEHALENVHRIFLVTPPWFFREEEIAKKIISIGKAKSLKQIVRLSAICAEEISEFGHHSEADQVLRESDIASISLLPNTFMQNFSNFKMVSKETGYTIKLPAGTGKTSFIDIRDIAAVAAKMLRSHQYDNNKYILTGAEALGFFEVAEKFSQALGKKVSYIPMDDKKWWEMMIQSGTPEVVAKSFLSFNQFVSKNAYASISPVVQEVLGRNPLNLNQFITDNISCF